MGYTQGNLLAAITGTGASPEDALEANADGVAERSSNAG